MVNNKSNFVLTLDNRQTNVYFGALYVTQKYQVNRQCLRDNGFVNKSFFYLSRFTSLRMTIV